MSIPFQVKNARRILLIRKKYSQALDADETAELEQLTEEVDAYIRKKFGRRSTEAIEDLEDFIRQLKEGPKGASP
jgi:hypothetical protein